MPRKPSRWRRLTTMTRWPVGVTMTSMRYLWRTTPLHRTEEDGSLEADMPPPVPDGVSLEEWQRIEDGYGPLFHRRYRTRIRESPMSPEELMDAFSAAPDWAAPTEFASFQKVKGEEDVMRVGDEWMVRMAAPWDGPVRVVDKTPTSFRMITLDDHLEAGQIEFSTYTEGEWLIFEIESWARSATRTVHVLYDTLRLSKETQLHMWISTLEGVARLAKGKRTLGVDIHTRRVEMPDRRLADLNDLKVNYDPDGPHDPEHGWRIDDYCEPLPSEPPGEPIENGSFAAAQVLLRDYQVADPKMVRATYDRDAPLRGRNMLLEIRFLGIPVNRTGCRVGEIYDERREVDGRPVRVWGWSYQTLEGHFEQGEMCWMVWKWIDTGEVQFRIHSYMRNAEEVNPIINLGFKLVGQHERRRYLQGACNRMARLTAAAMQ